MHAIKGGWVGQTFALAKSNDSSGRKSRIRRSKEERKTMVESFIKKYQKLNNGSFPSLNLTHKEVGGSFYIVREIVREIIQENRVLGPAKLTPEEEIPGQFLEHYPLGSISIEAETHLSVSSDETHVVPDHQQDTSEELVLNSSGQFNGPEHQSFDNGQKIYGNHADEKNEESGKLICKEMQVNDTLDAEKNVKELQASTAKLNLRELQASTAKVTNITASVIVETFPLRSATKPTQSLDGMPGEAWNLAGTLEEKRTEKMELELGNGSSVLDIQSSAMNGSSLVDEKAATKLADPLLEMNPGLMDEKKMVNGGDPTLESSKCSTTEVHDIQDGRDIEVEVSHDDDSTSKTLGKTHMIGEIMPINAPNGTHTRNLSTIDSSSSCGESISEVVLTENKAEVSGSHSSQKESNPTLDRINLESWAGASKRSARPETNPLLAFFKAFVTAFVKFWSE